MRVLAGPRSRPEAAGGPVSFSWLSQFSSWCGGTELAVTVPSFQRPQHSLGLGPLPHLQSRSGLKAPPLSTTLPRPPAHCLPPPRPGQARGTPACRPPAPLGPESGGDLWGRGNDSESTGGLQPLAERLCLFVPESGGYVPRSGIAESNGGLQVRFLDSPTSLRQGVAVHIRTSAGPPRVTSRRQNAVPFQCFSLAVGFGAVGGVSPGVKGSAQFSANTFMVSFSHLDL